MSEHAPAPATPETGPDNDTAADTTSEGNQTDTSDRFSDQEIAPDTSAELEQDLPDREPAREALSGFKGLRSKISEATFKATSGIEAVKANSEYSVAGVKEHYLGLKVKAEQWVYDRYEKKSRTSMFKHSRQKYARKAEIARRHLSDTQIALSRNTARYATKDKDGKPIVNGFEADRKNVKLARLEEREKARNKLVEKQLVAQEKKRRRGMKNEARRADLSDTERARRTHLLDQTGSIDDFRKDIKQKLAEDLAIRMKIYERKLTNKKGS